MSPRAFDPDIVQRRLRHLRTLLDDLQGFGTVDVDALEGDRMLRYAVERILTQLVEVAAGANAHIGGALLGKVKSDYRSTFDLAVEAGAITKETAARVEGSVGTRNVLVHEYLDVDLAKVAAAASRAPADYGQYIREVAEFLLRGLSGGGSVRGGG